jgi:predicted transglutaminase-like cysteine proteinase
MAVKAKSMLALAGLAAALGAPAVEAAVYGVPRWVVPQQERIAFAEPSLPPLGHTRFCLRHPRDCEVRLAPFRGPRASLTQRRWAGLVEVNAAVNAAIDPQANGDGIFGEEWLLSPAAGDCNDYAVTKRHKLLARGWPSRSLLLAEVVTAHGEHHLVLVVRLEEGDFVLDNLTDAIRPWSRTGYRWVRVQSPDDPRFWSAVGAPGTRTQRKAATGRPGV